MSLEDLKGQDYGVIAKAAAYGAPGGFAAGYITRGMSGPVQTAAIAAGSIAGAGYLAYGDTKFLSGKKFLYSIPGVYAGLKMSSGGMRFAIAGALGIVSTILVDALMTQSEKKEDE